jgi:hypothetical protein
MGFRGGLQLGARRHFGVVDPHKRRHLYASGTLAYDACCLQGTQSATVGTVSAPDITEPTDA